MRKYFKWLGVILVVIVACFAYSHIDKMHAIFNEDVDPSLYVGSEVQSKEIFEQKFVSDENALDGIALKFNITGENIEKVNLVYEIADESGETIRSGELSGDKFQNQKYNKLSFERINNSKNKEFIFRCYTENNDEENGISFLKEGDTLVMKCYMSRFDFETFIIAVALCLYVIVFMNILFKMFKE